MFAIKKLEINHFRGIDHLLLDFHEQINVIIGDNGSGKSAVLDCLAIMLSHLVGRFQDMEDAVRSFTDQDITNGMSETRNLITAHVEGKDIQWSLSAARKHHKSQISTDLSQLMAYVQEHHDNMTADFGNLPLIVHYSVNRAVLDIPLRLRENAPFEQLAAYDQAITSGHDGFRIFFEWFREHEDLENEMRLEDNDYRDHRMEAVRKAIEGMLPGFSGLRVRRSPLRMTVQKNDEALIVNQLSDGEKCLLALVGDLAWRLAFVNVDENNPLEGNAVVLIDEVDLHLHPGWQRRIVPALTRTFPKCQFVLTTHSPQILSHVRPENIMGLRRVGKQVEKFHPESAYGLDSNRILEDMMGVPKRPYAIKQELSELFLTINKGRLDEAKKMIADLMQNIGDDPELVKAGAIIRRKEIIGR